MALNHRTATNSSVSRLGGDDNKPRRKRHGPIFHLKVKCAHFLSRHSSLDNSFAFMWRNKWWIFVLIVMGIVFAATKSSKKSVNIKLGGSTVSKPENNRPFTTIRIQETPPKPDFAKIDRKERQAPLNERISGLKAKKRSSAWQTYDVEPSRKDSDQRMLPTTTRMIGAFASNKDGSGGLHRVHYFPAQLEIYPMGWEIAMSNEEYEVWKYPPKSRWYRHNAADPFAVGDCVPMHEWQKHSFPTCNTLHETGLHDMIKNNPNSTDMDEERVRLVNNGYWRDVWIVDDAPSRGGPTIPSFVVKTIRYEHDYTQRNYERHRRDAVAMERLTSSPYVVNIFGFCANSGVFEFSSGGDVRTVVEGVQRRGYEKNKRNGDLSSFEKLLIATQVSLGLRDLHNYPTKGRASIAHTDITPTQFIEINGFYKLNDFNRARFLTFNQKTNEPCTYEIGNNPGTVRNALMSVIRHSI